MASPVTLRLNPALRQRVERIAKRKRCPTSVVLREAITNWVEKEETALTPYELVKDLIGVVHGGDPGRSTRRLTDVLKARRVKP
jgi:predicted DNA-binding protein